jgi:hypothetical protein
MVYKRHLGGVAAAQYTVTLRVWTWTWMVRVCVVPDVHKDEVSVPSKPGKKFRQIIKHVKSIITQLYISKEYAN